MENMKLMDQLILYDLNDLANELLREKPVYERFQECINGDEVTDHSSRQRILNDLYKGTKLHTTGYFLCNHSGFSVADRQLGRLAVDLSDTLSEVIECTIALYQFVWDFDEMDSDGALDDSDNDDESRVVYQGLQSALERLMMDYRDLEKVCRKCRPRFQRAIHDVPRRLPWDDEMLGMEIVENFYFSEMQDLEDSLEQNPSAMAGKRGDEIERYDYAEIMDMIRCILAHAFRPVPLHNGKDCGDCIERCMRDFTRARTHGSFSIKISYGAPSSEEKGSLTFYLDHRQLLIECERAFRDRETQEPTTPDFRWNSEKYSLIPPPKELDHRLLQDFFDRKAKAKFVLEMGIHDDYEAEFRLKP